MSELRPEAPLSRDERTLQSALFDDEPVYLAPPPGNDAAFIRRVQSSHQATTRRVPLMALFGAAACAAVFFVVGAPLGPAPATGVVHVAPTLAPPVDLPPVLSFLLDDDGDLFASFDDDASPYDAPLTLAALDDESLVALNDVLGASLAHAPHNPKDTP